MGAVKRLRNANPRIAVVIDLDWTLKHHHDVFAGVHRYAQERKWDCVVWPHAPEFRSGRHKKAFDGIIGRVTPEVAQVARRAKIPLVNVWLSSTVVDAPTVVHDARAAGGMAGEHFLARGFLRFGFLGFRNVRASREVERGYRAVVDDGTDKEFAHLAVANGYNRNRASWERFRATVLAWVESLRPPIAILAINDMMARYVSNFALQIGLKVPQDVAIVGCENEVNVCVNPEPTLSSIEFGFDRVGHRAAMLLEDLMNGRSAPTEPIAVAPRDLVARASTDAFAVDDPIVAQALKFIANESNRPIKVEDVVQQVPTTWRTLDRRFRKSRDRTIAEEISHMRIERAKRLLIETGFPVNKVATECGFANAKRLCETFQRQQGMSPGEYRRENCR